MSFHIRQKVVCVDDNWEHQNWVYIPNRPVRGETYTIRNMCNYRHGIGFHLNEISNSPYLWEDGHLEGFFPSFRFRPVIERKTDISALRALLVPGSKILEKV